MIWQKVKVTIRITAILIINLMCIMNLSAKKMKDTELIYIRTWTNPSYNSLVSMKLGQESFIANKCVFKNCYVTDKFLVPLKITNYDSILFYSAELIKEPSLAMPTKRSVEQIYVFVTTEPAANYPITNYYDNFFNWTWTYKLDSDVVAANIIIKDKNGRVIGPKKDMNWIPLEVMNPLNENILNKLKNKKIAVAWYIEDCTAIDAHQNFLDVLRKELEKYHHDLQILGPCSEDDALCFNNVDCYRSIQSKYYFHLSFENAMSEDYVTDQLLIALNYYAVPVVFGGANYTRFMLDGIYLDAFELGPADLATKISSLIKNIDAYYDMFKWHQHYSYHEAGRAPDSNSICTYCELLNKSKKVKTTKVYTNIVKWYNERKDWNINAKPTMKYEVTRWM